MKRRIEKAAVLGAGTMGARIAAHFANAGIPCYLLDIVPPELNADEKRKGLTLESPAVRNRIVLAGLEGAKKSKPAAFFTRRNCATGYAWKLRRQPRLVRGSRLDHRSSRGESGDQTEFAGESRSACVNPGRSSLPILPACPFT